MRLRASVFALLVAACGNHSSGETTPDAGLDASVDAAPDPRQPERDASIFANLDFEQVDGAGVPADWKCYCNGAQATCQTTTGTVKHGTHALLLAPGCFAYQDIEAFDASKAVRFDMFAFGGAIYPMDIDAFGEVESMFVDGLPDAQSTWRPVASAGLLRTAGTSFIGLELQNTSASDLVIDDIIAVQDQPNPAPKSASLLHATHWEQLELSAGTEPVSVYTPMPMDYATQTPLYLELDVEPTTAVDHIEYTAEPEHDWGAIVHFNPTASGTITLAWQGVVLVRSIDDSERPVVYAADGDPSQWLPASPIADASYAGIATNAAALIGSSAAALDKMLATIKFTSGYITNLTQLTALDATTAYNTKDGSCTGFANLGMATGRALAVPARHVVNILVGDAQDMHSINEFYLGAALGWRRVEPQATAATVPEDYGLIMRLVLPADEGAAALAERFNIIGGVPLHEFTEPVDGGDRLSAGFFTHWANCPDCSNRADPQVYLRDDAATVESVFDRARTRWATDVAAYAAGGPDAATIAARRAILGAHTLADVSAMLDALDALP
jgi:hypothetical protein